MFEVPKHISWSVNDVPYGNFKTFLDQKKQYSETILKILNPLLTSYVDANNITIVIEKKNILVGAKSLDITTNMLDILNKEINFKINKFFFSHSS